MTIVYVLVAVLIGWVIGFLDSNLRTSNKIKSAESKAQLAISEAEKKIAAAQAGVRPGTPSSIDAAGLLRLKNVDGLPSLEMDGTLLNVKTVTAEQKRRLIELLSSIRPWVEGGQPLQPVSKPAPPVSAQPGPLPIQRATPSNNPILTQPLPATKSVEEKDFKSLSIVLQIDSVLQTRLLDSPLSNRGIRLTESSTGGVEVNVGNQKYGSVDDVPDQQIKMAIRAAIAEWEQKFTPGL
jgi:hypothetical protein